MTTLPQKHCCRHIPNMIGKCGSSRRHQKDSGNTQTTRESSSSGWARSLVSRIWKIGIILLRKTFTSLEERGYLENITKTHLSTLLGRFTRNTTGSLGNSRVFLKDSGNKPLIRRPSLIGSLKSL